MDMDGFEINKIREGERMSKILSVRITKSDFDWIKKNKVSATKLFNYALHKVMKKERGKNGK